MNVKMAEAEPGILDPAKINPTALAYMGDAVYEIYIRKHVLEHEQVHVDKIHQAAIVYVRAEGQAKAVRAMLAQEGFLTPEETALVKRTRNRKVTSRPKNADPVDYKLATAFEALIGYLYLKDDIQRLSAITGAAVRVIEGRTLDSETELNENS